MNTLKKALGMIFAVVILFSMGTSQAWAQKQKPTPGFSKLKTAYRKLYSSYLKNRLQNAEAKQLADYMKEERVASPDINRLGYTYIKDTKNSLSWFGMGVYDPSFTTSHDIKPYSVLRVEVIEGAEFNALKNESNYTNNLNSRRIEITVETVMRVTDFGSNKMGKNMMKSGAWWVNYDQAEFKDWWGDLYEAKREDGVGVGIVIYLDEEANPKFKPSSYVSLGLTGASLEAFAQEIRLRLSQNINHQYGWGLSFVAVDSNDDNVYIKALMKTFGDDMVKLITEFQKSSKSAGFATSSSTFFSETATNLSGIASYTKKLKVSNPPYLRGVLKPLVW